MAPQQFFGILHAFVQQFNNARAEGVKRRARAEQERLRREKEERARAAKEERQRQKQLQEEEEEQERERERLRQLQQEEQEDVNADDAVSEDDASAHAGDEDDGERASGESTEMTPPAACDAGEVDGSSGATADSNRSSSSPADDQVCAHTQPAAATEAVGGGEHEGDEDEDEDEDEEDEDAAADVNDEMQQYHEAAAAEGGNADEDTGAPAVTTLAQNAA
jgi:hypothetical protein